MNWDDTTIKSFVDTSEYTGFYSKLDQYIKPYFVINFNK